MKKKSNQYKSPQFIHKFFNPKQMIKPNSISPTLIWLQIYFRNEITFEFRARVSVLFKGNPKWLVRVLLERTK